MKTSKVRSLTAAALLVSLVNAEQVLAGPGGPHGAFDLLLGSPFSTVTDTDGDGRISPEEMQAARLVEFNAIRGEDYFVTLAEMATGQLNKAGARYTALNTDGTEGLTIAEFTAGKTGESAVTATNLFKIGDADGNSLLTLDEYKAFVAVAMSPILPFAAMDTNGDAKLSEAEFTTLPRHGGGKDKGPR